VLDVEIARIYPDTQPEEVEPLLEAAGMLGASHLLTVGEDASQQRLAEKLAALADVASTYGVRPVLEFMPFSEVATLPQALQVLSAAQHPGIGLLIDVLHLVRSGGGVADLAGVDGSRLHYAHICDAPARGPSGREALRHEARFARVLPGRGELPVLQFVEALPANLPLAVEVPGAVQGGVAEKVAAAGDAVRSLLAASQRAR
jgi:sugar phosphate isomerase/epimerase